MGAVQRLDLVLNFSDVLIGPLVVPNAVGPCSCCPRGRRGFDELSRGALETRGPEDGGRGARS